MLYTLPQQFDCSGCGCYGDSATKKHISVARFVIIVVALSLSLSLVPNPLMHYETIRYSLILITQVSQGGV